MYNETIKLSNEVIVPQLAFGTWLIDDGVVTDAVKAAVEIGYRHIDTAQAYGNERGVGEGVRTCGIQRPGRRSCDDFCQVYCKGY